MKGTAFPAAALAALILGFPRAGDATDLVGGELPTVLTPEEALAAFTVAEGYQVNLWASEIDMGLQSPAAMTFDSQGRLWVACMPSQPHALPDQRPSDFVLVLEDTNRDGVADKSTVFHDDLYLPMGLAVAEGGRVVYVCSEPHLLKLTDRDGDLKADEAEIMLSGFGTEDNHHFISGFQWGPCGRLFFGQGLFLNTQVETPFGPVRAHEGAVFRLDPRNHRLEVFAAHGWSNVWGVIFDHWGQGLVADASPGFDYYLSHVASRHEYPKPGMYEDPVSRAGGYSFTPPGRRPTCGNELLLSSHFPEETRGWYTNNQMKGWHGVRWYELSQEGSGYAASQPRGEEELLTSSDITFRPVAQQIGPDGALYVLDYYNPIVGHTTYSFRDPRRIQTHGRVWRITAKDRPLAWQPAIHGEPVAALLGILQDKENYRWRYHARRELQERPADEVLPPLREWIAAASDEHDLTEALWVLQGLDHPDFELLRRLLAAENPDARTAAARVARYWQEHLPPAEAEALFQGAIADPSQRVRLEALLACAWLPDRGAALAIAAEALDQEMDAGFHLAARETLGWLARGADQVPVKVSSFLLPWTEDAELAARPLDREVSREILRRPALEADKHRAALALLGSAASRSPVEELLHQLEDGAEGEHRGLLDVLISRLLDWEHEDIRGNVTALERLAGRGGGARIRASAGAALLRLGVALELPDGASDSRKLDLLGAVKLAGRGQAPQALADTVASLLDPLHARAVRLAAVDAAPLFPPRDAEHLRLLAATAERHAGDDLELSFAALEAIQRVPRDSWPEDFVAKPLSRVRISATPNLRFDPGEFRVAAGSAVELTFHNPDNLYHNLVLVDAGAEERIGLAADLMAGDPEGLAKHYVPDDPAVLQWTPQLTIGGARTHVLRFYAPAAPGGYHYLCTYPGHWRAMRGVMRVEE